MTRFLDDVRVPSHDLRAPIFTNTTISVRVFGASLQDGLDNCIVNVLHLARTMGLDFGRNIAVKEAQASILAEAEDVQVDGRVRHHLHLSTSPKILLALSAKVWAKSRAGERES